MGFGDIFKRFRKNDIVIDLGDLQKRGIIKQPVAPATESGIVDLTGTSNTESSSSGSADSESGSALGFLGALAGTAGTEVGSSSETSVSTDPISSVTDRRTRIRGVLRDMKVDMKNTTDRIYKLSDRLEVLERKIDRLERRSGLD